MYLIISTLSTPLSKSFQTYLHHRSLASIFNPESNECCWCVQKYKVIHRSIDRVLRAKKTSP